MPDFDGEDPYEQEVAEIEEDVTYEEPAVEEHDHDETETELVDEDEDDDEYFEDEEYDEEDE